MPQAGADANADVRRTRRDGGEPDQGRQNSLPGCRPGPRLSVGWL